MIRHVFLAALAATGIGLAPPVAGNAAEQQCGGASWYAMPGSRTANGESMNPDAMTAAHKTLPFGSTVEIVNQRNGRALRVRINDRGPFIRGRIIDVSRAAANQLGFLNRGHDEVCIRQV